MNASHIAQTHVIVHIDLDCVILAHIDGRAGQHSIYGEYGTRQAVGGHAIWSKAVGHIVGAVEAGLAQHRVPLHCPVVLAEHGRCHVRFAAPRARVIRVVFSIIHNDNENYYSRIK